MSDSQKIIEELQKKNRELVGKLAILQKQFDDALDVTHSFDGISNKNTELEKEIHNYISKNDDLTRRIQILSQTNAELTKKYDEEKANWQSHNRCEINDLQNKLNRCQSEHEKELMSLKLKIEQTEKEHSFAVENYQKEIRRIYDAASQFLGTPIRETDTLITLLLSKTNSSGQGQGNQNSLPCPQCIRAKVDIRSKDQSLKEIRCEIKSLKNQTQKLNSVARDQAQSIETLSNEKAELIEANRFLNNQLNDIQKGCEEQMREIQVRYKKVKSKLSASKQNAEALEKEKININEQIKAFQTTISEKESELLRLTNEVQKLADQNSNLDQTVSSLKDKCQELNDTLQKNNETVEENELKAKNSHNALETLHKIMSEQKEEIINLQSQRLKLISHLQVLNSTLSQYETHTSELLSKNAESDSPINLNYSQFPQDLNQLLSQIIMNPETKDEERVQNAFSIIYNYYNNIINTLNESINKYRNDLQAEQLRFNQVVDNYNRRLQNSFDDRNLNNFSNNNIPGMNTGLNFPNGIPSQAINGMNQNQNRSSNNYNQPNQEFNSQLNQSHLRTSNNTSNTRSEYNIESNYDNLSISNNRNNSLQNGNNGLNIPPINNGNIGFSQENPQNGPYSNSNINDNNQPPFFNGNLNPSLPNGNTFDLQPNNNNVSSTFNTDNYSNQQPIPNINRNSNDNYTNHRNGNNSKRVLPDPKTITDLSFKQSNQPPFSFNNDESNSRVNNNAQDFNNSPFVNRNGNNYQNADVPYNQMNRCNFQQQSSIRNSEIYRKIESLDKMNNCQDLMQKVSEKENQLHEIFAILHVNCFLDAKSSLDQIQNDIQLLQTKLREKKGKMKELVNEYRQYQAETEEKMEATTKAIAKVQKRLQESEDLRESEKLKYESKIKDLICYNEEAKDQIKQMKIRVDQKVEKNNESKNKLQEELRLKLNEHDQLLQTIEALRCDISKKDVVIQQQRSFTKYFAKRQSQKHTNEKEDMKCQLSQIIEQLKFKNLELKKSLCQMKEKMTISEQQYSKAKKQISEYASKIQELEIQIESLQNEAERGKSIIESKHKAALKQQETEFQSHIEDSKFQIENAKREIMAYVGLQFCSLFNAKEQIDSSNFESFVQRLRQKFESLISMENNIRRMLSLNPDDSVESAVSLLLSQKNV